MINSKKHRGTKLNNRIREIRTFQRTTKIRYIMYGGSFWLVYKKSDLPKMIDNVLRKLKSQNKRKFIDNEI